MSAMTELNVTVGVPAGAIPLPINETGDMTAWAESVARSRLPVDAPQAQLADFARMLLACTAESRARGPKIMAMAFCPDPSAGELARIEVSDMAPSAQWPDLNLKQLGEFFAGPLHPHALLPPETTSLELPAGPAVRVRQQFLTQLDEDQVGRVMETIVYAIRPPETSAAVVLTVSWQALYYGRALTELAEKLAQTVQLG
ncbi:hypothetical protein KGQ20_36230 [Catenulispora sp. NF23]|uniref:Uncharacterized protein n=1 Tax=Catenulispora pinistramenti TaxID=2705254 RepID=A0ABS5L5R0_9ACTN|nr:hypothetical protein [Catenulispora pinistramenti]MBS2538214.1 hypothetical protein [Catenulispora pinistramenti]MBS2553678.1 hypothetical protein [Catenulispora pinistramenti]